jgi:hypothetical protein
MLRLLAGGLGEVLPDLVYLLTVPVLEAGKTIFGFASQFAECFPVCAMYADCVKEGR